MTDLTHPRTMSTQERQILRDLDERLRGIRTAISTEINLLSDNKRNSDEVQHELIPGLKAARYSVWSVQRDIHEYVKASQFIQ